MRGCPGDEVRYGDMMDPDETECPNCGHLIEFFANDRTRRCAECGETVANPSRDEPEEEDD